MKGCKRSGIANLGASGTGEESPYLYSISALMRPRSRRRQSLGKIPSRMVIDLDITSFYDDSFSDTTTDATTGVFNVPDEAGIILHADVFFRRKQHGCRRD